MFYVFDASFVGALIIPDETNAQVSKMYSRIKNEDERHAPQLIWYEITNIFNNLIRHRRFTEDQVIELYPHLSAFCLICDNATGTDYSRKLLRLCRGYNLSSYDAAYLELAKRKGAVLCTLDGSLKVAAKKHGVPVLK